MINKSLNFISSALDELGKQKLQVNYADEKIKFIKTNLMKKYKALILDDEVYGRENLALMIETKFEDVEIVGKAESVEDALVILQQTKVDIVFLDIRLENSIGFELLENLPQRNFATVVVSGYDEYGITALKHGVVDYILKPIHIDDLDKAMIKAKLFVDHLETKPPRPMNTGVDKLKISTFNGFSLIEMKDIIRLESDSNYTQVFLTDGSKLVVSKTMKEFEPYLNEDTFFRIHRSHIINVNFVKGYNSKDGGYAVLKDESMIEISRSKHKEFMDFISQKFNSIS
jgi:two-component system LytT family response regulator